MRRFACLALLLALAACAVAPPSAPKRVVVLRGPQGITRITDPNMVKDFGPLPLCERSHPRLAMCDAWE